MKKIILGMVSVLSILACSKEAQKTETTVTSVELNKTTLELIAGESETLVAIVKPSDVTDKTVTWSTSNASIATVENGKVTAIKEGEATITAQAGEKTADCKVVVLSLGAVSSGVFSVSSTQAVKFSKGNLQYNSDTQAWQFAENQYTYVGDAAGNTSVTEEGVANSNGIVDLFGWVGASSNWTGLKQYGISSSMETGYVNGYGNVPFESLKSDWGTLIGTGWRTLTKDEWTYLFNTRTVNGGTGSGKSYTLGQSVEGKKGVVLYPDNYTGSVYSGSDWSTFEAAGCVFLPGAGCRFGTSVHNVGSGFYWSSTPDSSSVDYAFFLYFGSSIVGPAYNHTRCNGYSVRLVRNQ